MMKKILMALGLLTAYPIFGQSIQSHIYVCTDPNDTVRLNNLKTGAGCVERVVTVALARTSPKVPAFALNDPLPAPNALVVSKGTQARRDASRSLILQAELAQAEQNLNRLQADYQSNPTNRTTAMAQQIKNTQASIESLKREISREQ